jgi:hypothetical protein
MVISNFCGEEDGIDPREWLHILKENCVQT